MTVGFPVHQSGGAATLCQMGHTLMDVILHVGAQRTATTSFQHHMRTHHHVLASERIAFWGPEQTRRSVFPGLFRIVGLQQRRHVGRPAEGRIKMMTAQLAQTGTQHLIVSDENMIGTCAQNFRTCALYPAIGERMARVAAAFEGRIARIVLSLRAQDLWWASAAAMTVARGHKVPDAAKCRAITQHPRSWREVITDLACAVPDADIQVVPFEQYVGQPEKLLSTALGRQVSFGCQSHWLNRSADLDVIREIVEQNGGDPSALPKGAGRWQPFTPDECAALRETYADDLHWLTAGADGLARLTQDTSRTRADISVPPGQNIKGQSYD
jgi:hypothetical protein